MNHDSTQTQDAALYFFGGQLLLEYKDSHGATIKKCISPQAARAAFANEATDSDWLPPKTCRYGEGPNGTWIMLKHEPAQYELSLADPFTAPGHADSLTTLSVPLPGLLFLGVERHYFLWAFKTWKDSTTALYQVPLPNVHPNGAICFGNSAPPLASGKGIAKAWTVFWDSQFSNELANHKSRTHQDNVLLELAELHQQHARTYPAEDLVRAKITLPNIFQQLTDVRNGPLL